MGSDTFRQYSAIPNPFQSTLPRGERPRTGSAAPHILRRKYFNPRSHVGSDYQFTSSAYFLTLISIHAPTWGATCWRRGYPTGATDFNPRSHVGSDGLAVTNRAVQHYFNPRSHVGSDVVGVVVSALTSDFNPRSHVGSDGKRLCSSPGSPHPWRFTAFFCSSKPGTGSKQSKKSLKITHFPCEPPGFFMCTWGSQITQSGGPPGQCSFSRPGAPPGCAIHPPGNNNGYCPYLRQ